MQGFAFDLQANYMASLCSSCHSTTKNSSNEIPSLSGYDENRFLIFFSDLKKSNDKSSIVHNELKKKSKLFLTHYEQ